MFLPLTKAEIRQILLLLLKKVEKMLARQRLTIQLTKKALDYLGDAGFDPQFGARPMKRALQDILIDEMSRQLLAGNFAAGETIYVDEANDELTFSNKKNIATKTVSEWRKEEAAARPMTIVKPKSRSRGKENREKQLDELKKATDDLNEAVKEVKKN